MSLATTVRRKASWTLPVGASVMERPVHVAIHDGHWVEWEAAIPLPDHGHRRYTIEAEFELPPDVLRWDSPWPPLQTFTRLDGASGVVPSGDPATDTLRRAALSLAQLLDQARRGFERHCRLSSASRAGSGLLVLAMVAWVAYAMHDGICAVADTWFTGKPYRYRGRCTTFCPVPGRRGASRVVIARAREWYQETIHALPDALTSEPTVSLRASVVGYMQKGLVTRPSSLAASGATGIRHVFRCDLSPLITRVHRGDRRVPVTEAGRPVSFDEAPNRYHIPLFVRVRYGDQTHQERVTLVVDRRGLHTIPGYLTTLQYDGKVAGRPLAYGSCATPYG